MQNHSRTDGGPENCGGDFLENRVRELDVFAPEDFSEEQLMIRDLAARFVQDEVLPQQPNIERQEWDVTVRLIKRCAELGLLGIEVPEGYGGASLDRVSAMIVAEQLARVLSFSVSCGGQSGIGTLPILYFGSEELRNKYLPLLCNAQKLSAYALSEAGSGSDALAAKATAMRSADGSHWILNGEKMWVTNAAFADIFITFAKVDGKHFSCFIVERSYSGVSTGAEEHKMGLKGSSTRPVVLADVPVPIGNLIGEVGRGHEVAFNILNIGRTKLAAAAVGGSKTALDDAIRYSKQRIAFGKSISSFGAIQYKLGEMAIRIWITEGMVYRTANLMDQAIHEVPVEDRKRTITALKEYAVECSIVKVFGSETLDYVVDEAVQIFGGYGFSAEYPVERYYRDSRVNRIFEGTNEINRLMISGMLQKRPFTPAELPEQSGILSNEAAALGRIKKTYSILAASANPNSEQEVLMLLADIAIGIYAMDTALHRARKLVRTDREAAVALAIFRTFLNDEISRIAFAARQVLAATMAATMKNTFAERLSEVEALLHWAPIDTVRTRRLVAEHLLDSGRYSL
jgi:alkylation response protein AidB-like acyl-CoA dehydrogenase